MSPDTVATVARSILDRTPTLERFFAADLGGRFGAEGRFGYRLNVAHERLRPLVRNLDGDRSLFALATDWRLGRDSLLEAEIEWSRKSQASQTGFSLLGAATALACAARGSRRRRWARRADSRRCGRHPEARVRLLRGVTRDKPGAGAHPEGRRRRQANGGVVRPAKGRPDGTEFKRIRDSAAARAPAPPARARNVTGKAVPQDAIDRPW